MRILPAEGPSATGLSCNFEAELVERGDVVGGADEIGGTTAAKEVKLK
jgi:hypothetical protein